MSDQEKKNLLQNSQIFLSFISLMFTGTIKFLHTSGDIKDNLFDITFNHVSSLIDLGKHTLIKVANNNLSQLC